MKLCIHGLLKSKPCSDTEENFIFFYKLKPILLKHISHILKEEPSICILLCKGQST